MTDVSAVLCPPARGFAPAEFATRVERAQRIMRVRELDALFVTSPPNIRYFTGFDTQFWESPTRPWFIVVPNEGKPVAVIPEIGAPEMALTWIEDIRTWAAPVPEDDGLSLLAAALDAVPRRFGRVGAELGREMALRMPVLDFLALRDRLRSEIVDGAPALWEMRMVKTDAEIDRIAFICQIASDAYEALPAKLSIGETEREAARKLRIDIARRGPIPRPSCRRSRGRGACRKSFAGRMTGFSSAATFCSSTRAPPSTAISAISIATSPSVAFPTKPPAFMTRSGARRRPASLQLDPGRRPTTYGGP